MKLKVSGRIGNGNLYLTNWKDLIISMQVLVDLSPPTTIYKTRESLPDKTIARISLTKALMAGPRQFVFSQLYTYIKKMFSSTSREHCQSRYYKEWHPDYIAAYNSLNDKNLKHFFNHPARKNHLTKNHLVSAVTLVYYVLLMQVCTLIVLYLIRSGTFFIEETILQYTTQ